MRDAGCGFSSRFTPKKKKKHPESTHARRGRGTTTVWTAIQAAIAKANK
jgi:hypothetical protein